MFYNVQFFFKIIVARLNSYLNRIIPKQGGFLLGRIIFKKITLSQEMIHSLNRKNDGGNADLKVDMAKAYDCVDWHFLVHVMVVSLIKFAE